MPRDWWWGILGNALGTVLALVLSALLIQYLLLVDKLVQRRRTDSEPWYVQMLSVGFSWPVFLVAGAPTLIPYVVFVYPRVSAAFSDSYLQTRAVAGILAFVQFGLTLGLAVSAGTLARALGYRPESETRPARTDASPPVDERVDDE